MSTAVVFVHGLEGDKCKTWGLDDGCTGNDNDKINDAIEKALKKDQEDQYEAFYSKCESCEYYSFGYDTSWKNITSIDDKISSLKEYLQTIEKENTIDNYVFVCHSLGGLLLKEYIVKDSLEKPIKGIIFYGTPHKGGFYGLLVSPRPWILFFLIFLPLNHLELMELLYSLLSSFFGTLFVVTVSISFMLKTPIKYIIYLLNFRRLKKLDITFGKTIGLSIKRIYRHEGRAMWQGFLPLVPNIAATPYDSTSASVKVLPVDGKNHIEMVKFFHKDNDNGQSNDQQSYSLLSSVLLPDLKTILNNPTHIADKCEEDFQKALPLYANSRNDTLVGRETDVDEIKEKLNGSKRVTVVAPGGYGKTAVIKEISKDKDFLQKYHKKFAWSFYGQGIEEDDTAKGLYDLAKGLDACWETGLSELNEKSMFQDIAEKLDDDSKKYLLVLDGIEVFYDYESNKWDENIKKILDPFININNVFILISSRKNIEGYATEYPLPELKKKDIKNYLKSEYNILLDKNTIETVYLTIPLILEIFLKNVLNKHAEKLTTNNDIEKILNTMQGTSNTGQSKWEKLKTIINNLLSRSSRKQKGQRTIENSIVATYLTQSEGFISDKTTKNSYMLLSLFDRKVDNNIYKDVIKKLRNEGFLENLSDSKIKQNINSTGFSSLSENNFFEIHPILQAHFRKELSKRCQKKYHKAIAEVFDKKAKNSSNEEKYNNYFLSAYHYLKAEEYQEAAGILYEHLGKDAKTREEHGRMRYLHTLFSQIDISKIKTNSDRKIKFATVQAYLYMTNGYTSKGFEKTKENYDAFSKDTSIDKSSIVWIDFLIHFAELANYSGNAGNEDYENAISDVEKKATALETIKDSIEDNKHLEKYFWDFLLRARINESRRYIKDDYDKQKELYETFKKIATNFKKFDLETFSKYIAKGKQKDINSSIETKHLYHKMSHNIWQDRTISYLLDKEIDKKIAEKDINEKLIGELETDTKKLLKIYGYKDMQRKNYIPLAYENLAKIDYLLGNSHTENIGNATKKAVETNKYDFILQTRIIKAYLDYLTKTTGDDNKELKNFTKNEIIGFRKFHGLQFKHLDCDIYILAILIDFKIEDPKSSCVTLQEYINNKNYKFRCSRIKAMIPKCYKSLESKCSE